MRQAASAAEESAYRALLQVRFTQGGQHRAGKAQQLQRVGLQKGLFSSPAAAIESVDKRIAVLRAKPQPTADVVGGVDPRLFGGTIRRRGSGLV